MLNPKSIESAGGPLVLVSDTCLKCWLGTYHKEDYLSIKTTSDFVAPSKTDYNRACLINDYIGVIDVGSEDAIVFGDEPMKTTIVCSSLNEILVARWFYGDEESEDLLKNGSLTSSDNWQFTVAIYLHCNNYYLFDSAYSGKDIINCERHYDFIRLKLIPGNYDVFTTIFEPNKDTKYLLHKFIKQ